MTVAIVGDVKAKKVLPMLKKYFSRMPAGPTPPPLRTVEPEQIAEKMIVLPDPSQPVYVEGYHRPSACTRTTRSTTRSPTCSPRAAPRDCTAGLVRDEKIAAFAGAFNGFPGTKYPHLMIFLAMPTPGHTNEEIQAAIREEIERIKTEPVSDDELRMVKTGQGQPDPRSAQQQWASPDSWPSTRRSTATGASCSASVDKNREGHERRTSCAWPRPRSYPRTAPWR